MKRAALVLFAAAAAALTACGREPDPAPTPAPRAAPPSVRKPSREDLVAAYDRGLDFIASKAKDGVFSVQQRPHVGVTGLCVLAMFERPGGMREEDRAVVDPALPWLARWIGADGGVDRDVTSNYETCIVATALARSRRPEFAADVARAVAWIKGSQYGNPENPAFGGIGASRRMLRGDLANTSYALRALEACGVPKDDEAFRRVVLFAQRCQNRKANETDGEPTRWRTEMSVATVRADDGGGVSWPGESKALYDDGPGDAKLLRSYGTMTCALADCYRMGGLAADDPRLAAAVRWLGEHWDVETNPGMRDLPPERRADDGIYYWYMSVGRVFPALGMETLRGRDGAAIDWRAQLGAKLLALQKPDGSWQSRNNTWLESVSLVATSFALSALAGCVER